jgi:hypothetical protein
MNSKFFKGSGYTAGWYLGLVKAPALAQHTLLATLWLLMQVGQNWSPVQLTQVIVLLLPLTQLLLHWLTHRW